jgi:hypothetical protein
MQRKQIFQFILKNAYVDEERCETVSTVNHDEVLNACPVTFLNIVPDIVKGEVLTDSRGQGSFQRKPIA